MNPRETKYFKAQDIEYLEYIAKGTFGEVYRVHSNKYKRDFALKKIPKAAFKDSEIECLKQIDDMQIVGLYHHFVFDGSVYMLMEYCTSDLSKFLGKCEPPKGHELHNYVYGVIKAVKACHDRNIAHCDIKPSNFFVDVYGRIKIGDFGLSTIFRDKPTASCIKGTPLFMAPEIMLPYEYNPIHADIWAMGVTLFIIATGKLPFRGRSTGDLVNKIEKGIYDSYEIEDEDLRALIGRCLEINPKDRANVNELLHMNYFTKFEQKVGFPLYSKNCIRSQFIIKPTPQNFTPLGKRYSTTMKRVKTFPRVQAFKNFE